MIIYLFFKRYNYLIISYAILYIYLIMLLLSIIFLPLLGSIASGLFGFYIGRQGSVFITTLTTFLTFLFSLITFYNSVTYEYEYVIYLATWINSGLFNCNWSFLFDTLTIVMLITVTSISTLVHLYSSQYMAEDPHLSRFMSYFLYLPSL